MGAIGEKISKETIREKVISTIDMTREPQEQELHEIIDRIMEEELKEKYAKNTDGIEWDIADDSVNVESTVLEPIAVSKFLDTLSETDRKILTMRMDDVTLEKIAEELGFKTHSAIHKRIRKIGLAYEKFSGEDLGFSNKKII